MTAFHFGGDEKQAPGYHQIEVPVGIESKRELLDFLAQAFPLPAYFGHNWDALEECLLDFDAGNEKIALVHQDVPMGASPLEQKIYVQILDKIAKDCLFLVVSFPSASRAIIEKLVAK